MNTIAPIEVCTGILANFSSPCFTESAAPAILARMIYVSILGGLICRVLQCLNYNNVWYMLFMIIIFTIPWVFYQNFAPVPQLPFQQAFTHSNASEPWHPSTLIQMLQKKRGRWCTVAIGTVDSPQFDSPLSTTAHAHPYITFCTLSLELSPELFLEVTRAHATQWVTEKFSKPDSTAATANHISQRYISDQSLSLIYLQVH